MRIACVRRGAAISVALLVSVGCATTHRHPVLPLPVRLASPTPFFAHVRARADTAANYCSVLRISGTVAVVRGDTLEFAALHGERRPNGASDCLAGRPAFVVLSSAPELQAVTVRANTGRTVGVALMLMSITILGSLLIVLYFG